MFDIFTTVVNVIVPFAVTAGAVALYVTFIDYPQLQMSAMKSTRLVTGTYWLCAFVFGTLARILVAIVPPALSQGLEGVVLSLAAIALGTSTLLIFKMLFAQIETFRTTSSGM